MARKELKTKHGVVDQIKALVAGEDVKYAVLQELLTLGYVTETDRVTTTAVKEAGRGRKKIVYAPTPSGRSLVNLSKSWKRAA